MFRKLAAAAIAVSLIAGPAFAQGNASATTNQPTVKTTTSTGVKAKEAGAVTVKTRKHVSLRHRHQVRHYAHVKHVKHFVHAKHIKHLKQAKRINAPVKAKISG
jgi:hypothetical protein